MIIFRAACFIQILAGFICLYDNTVEILETVSFFRILVTVCYAVVLALPVFFLYIYQTNYPAQPVAGRQKSVFNWLFLLNILVIVFLFMRFFTYFNDITRVTRSLRIPFTSLPVNAYSQLLLHTVLLLFHFVILYGLYVLRRELYINFMRAKQFDFEKKKEEG